MSPANPRRAYTTLITRATYLAGVIVLAYSLRKHGSQYPLIVCYTSKVSEEALEALELEVQQSDLILRKVEALVPEGKISLIAERFADTWTKLRVFEIQDYDEVCYLDADMLIMNRNMDEVFDAAAATFHGKGQDMLAATHTCCCNLDHDSWAPDDWTPENCPFTTQAHSDALREGASIKPDSPRTYYSLNGGLFLFRTSASLWDSMHDHFLHLSSSGKLATFKFPDQDFLEDYYRNRWVPLSWRFNALKTWRYWHTKIWRDGEVVCLHLIVDKPWATRIGSDGRAGYKGDDGVTHQWWWTAWNNWTEERRRSGDEKTTKLVEKHVASVDGAGDADDELSSIGGGAQNFAKKWDGEENKKS